MLLNCGVGEDSWESLGLQGDPTSPFWRRSALGFLWKEWCWSWNSSILATSCEELSHWKRHGHWTWLSNWTELKSKLKLCIWDNIQKGQCNYCVLPYAFSLSSCEVWECTATVKAGAWEMLKLRQASSWLQVQHWRWKIFPLGNASVNNSATVMQTLKKTLAMTIHVQSLAKFER